MNPTVISWIIIGVIVAGAAIYILKRKGILRGISFNTGDSVSRLERIEKKTLVERERNEALNKLLEAKKELTEVQADNERLQREIDAMTPKTLSQKKDPKLSARL